MVSLMLSYSICIPSYKLPTGYVLLEKTTVPFAHMLNYTQEKRDYPGGFQSRIAREGSEKVGVISRKQLTKQLNIYCRSLWHVLQGGRNKDTLRCDVWLRLIAILAYSALPYIQYITHAVDCCI